MSRTDRQPFERTLESEINTSDRAALEPPDREGLPGTFVEPRPPSTPHAGPALSSEPSLEFDALEPGSAGSEASGTNPLAPSSKRSLSSSYPCARFLPILPLSSGGMAHVELAVGIEAGNFKKLMVLKTIREELAFDPDIVAMFLGEARLCARLNHANLVQVYEVMESPRPRIVMEYLEGLSLIEIQRLLGDNFDTLVQLRILSDALAGLHYAHELCDYDGTPLDMVHRDVSPQNVVVTSDGRVKVLDFGIAKVANSPSYTQAGMVKGKMSYMSPEQLAGEPLDRRTDVFAVGCMLWRAATGKKLWTKASTEDIMRALVNGEIPAPSTCREVDPQLEAIVVRATAPDRKQRYESAAALRAALDEYLAEVQPSGCDLKEWMERTFTQHWESQREAVRARLVQATTMPPLPVSSVAPVELDRFTTVRTSLVPVSRRTRLATIGIVAAAVGVLLIGAMSLISAVAPRATSRHEALANLPAAGQLVPLRIKAEPTNARISVDGATIAGNPTTAWVTAGTEHLVEVAQQGYATLLRRFRVERETSLEFALVPELANARAPTSGKPVVTGASSMRQPSPAHHGNAPASPAAVASAASSAAAPAAPTEAQSAERDNPCAVPFYFEHGIKNYKPECL